MNRLAMRSVIVLFALVQMQGDSFAQAKQIHQHTPRDIGDKPIPKIALLVYRDTMDGVNIHIQVENYILNAPDQVSDEKRLNEKAYLQGHAHVFVNGIKRQRLYGKAIHIPNQWLKKGVNQVAISLNSHQHENWVAENQTIVASVFIDLSRDPLVLHNFTSQPILQ